MKLKKFFITAAIALGVALPATAATEGVDYEVLSVEVTPIYKDKIEVTEFFAYWCPTCAYVEPFLSKHARTFASDTVFRQEHIVWDEERDLGFARLAAAVKQTGAGHKANSAIFNAVVEQRINLSDVDKLAQWLPAQTTFDGKKVWDAYNSFSNLPAAKQMGDWTTQYNIKSTPTVIVGGKYHVLFTEKGGVEGGMKTIDELIEKVRQERGMSKPAPKAAPVPVKSWGARLVEAANK